MLVETGLQRFDTGVEWRQVGLHSAEGRLDRGWGVLPVVWRKGKRPSDSGECRRLIHNISRRLPRVHALQFANL